MGFADEPRRSLARAGEIQVLSAVGGLIVLLVVGIAIAVWLILNLSHETSRFTDREVEYVGAIQDIELISKTLANDERGYLISGSEEFLLQIEGRTAQLYEAFVRAYANADEAQWVRVDRAEKNYERWLAAMNENIAAYRRGDREAAIEASLGETRLIRKEYEATLAGTRGLATFSLESASEAVSATLTRAVVILLAYLVVAVVCGVAIAAWLVRRVLQPLGASVSALAGSPEQPVHRLNDTG